MKTHGMTFREDMAAALRNGTKTQTRRLIKPQPKPDPSRAVKCRDNIWMWESNSGKTGIFDPPQFECPWRAGDQIYVQEGWATRIAYLHSEPYTHDRSVENVLYRATQVDLLDEDVLWNPAKSMPSWAARTWLEVVKDPFPQRIQEILEADARAEGANAVGFRSETEGIAGYECRIDFNSIWESLYPGSWERNEYVWVLDLKLIEKGGAG